MASKYIFSVQRKNKGGEYPYRITPPHAVGFVLRSGVAPQRCPLSYTAAKICKVLETTKTFWEKVAKKGKVSHEVGHKKGETSRFPPIHTYDRCRLIRPKQFRVILYSVVVVYLEDSYKVGLLIDRKCVRCTCACGFVSSIVCPTDKIKTVCRSSNNSYRLSNVE